MSPARFVWITVWVALATAGYGVEALYIALAGHIGLHVSAKLLSKIIGPVASMLAICGGFYLMYLTVHLFGWGCWWLLFFSYMWVKVTYYPTSGALQSIEIPMGHTW